MEEQTPADYLSYHTHTVEEDNFRSEARRVSANIYIRYARMPPVELKWWKCDKGISQGHFYFTLADARKIQKRAFIGLWDFVPAAFVLRARSPAVANFPKLRDTEKLKPKMDSSKILIKRLRVFSY